jgi:predicted  nucleic acid-binding Zn-ribbon protein
MPRFRCTNCGRRVESPVVIGAGDCPHCGGDVVFDLHGDPETPDDPSEPDREKGGQSLLRRLLRRG